MLVIIASCTPKIKNTTIYNAGPDEIRKNWTLKNTVTNGDYVLLEAEDALLISKFKAQNFDLHMRIKTSGGAEGALGIHTTPSGSSSSGKGYSVIINNSDYRIGNPEKTGSLSRIRNFFIRMVEDEEWFDLFVSVKGNHIQVSVGDKIVSEYYEPEIPLRMEGLADMILSEGNIVLEKSGNDGSIFVSEINIEAFENDIPFEDVNFETTDEIAQQLTLLNQQRYPVIDFHGHLKGGLTIDQAAKYGRDHGFNYGIAANCGLNFPVTDDSSLNAYYEELSNEPVFKVMQCEGREWVTLFQPEGVEQFDYIFTDAMTFTDHRGRRMRLWMRNEVVVEDPEQFMDMLVGKIIGILSQEPVDIYVNPTFLPTVIEDRYDELWTAERMDKVIEALVKYEVALEINSRYEIPSIDFIKRAKDGGVKFTLGTNNNGADDLGRQEYGIKAINEVGITPDDIWLPRPTGQKKVGYMGIPEEVTG